ncbi:hypothetical protein V494_04847 [Pseudogymnoascus sp. VKM F-4513 (FW-928)]|nr:hypothetical protein V494_04847 [Pseudogymnoascus sp. VKM F-4513 (FW-928)]
MASFPTGRPYDLILFGATGYIGSLIARYLSASSPTTLKWAVSGRNMFKLQELVHTLEKDNPHRPAPGIVLASLARQDLDRMTTQADLVINVTGPFCKYGTPVVEACIRNRAAYVDSTGEHVWVNEIAARFHDQARAQNTIIIPQCAIESSPPDIMCLALANCISEHQLSPLSPVSFSIEHSWPGYTGGTIASIFAVLETYSLSQMNAAGDPLASCLPGAGQHNPYPAPILPVYHDPFLGPLTFNPSAMTDRATVMRTWSLLQVHGEENERYGDSFSLNGYQRASSMLQGWFSFLGMSVAVLFVILIPPIRSLLKWMAPPPGTGPEVGKHENHFVEWRAVVSAGANGIDTGNKAIGVMRVDMDVYNCVAMMVSEAALTLLEQQAAVGEGKQASSLAMSLGGGILTPATLGWDYINKLKAAGLFMEVDMLRGGGSPTKKLK